MAEDAELPACFNAIKKTAGFSTKIEVVHTDPLELQVDEESWKDFPENYKEAVNHFNALLRSCHELLSERKQTLEYIEGRLSKIETLSEGKNELKDIPMRIGEFVEQVESLLEDINAATYFFGNDSISFVPTGS